MKSRQSLTASDRASGNTSEASLALRYALGELSATEEAAFESATVAGTPESQELVEILEGMTAIAEKMASDMPAPRKSLKNQILLSVIGEAGKQPGDDQHLVRADASEWIEEPNSPGIKLKILYQDPVSHHYTVVVELAPGARYPKHRHAGLEQCYIISGTLHVNDIDLGAGDYIVTPDGTLHHDTHSKDGCVLLLTTSLQDEILE